MTYHGSIYIPSPILLFRYAQTCMGRAGSPLCVCVVVIKGMGLRSEIHSVDLLYTTRFAFLFQLEALGSVTGHLCRHMVKEQSTVGWMHVVDRVVFFVTRPLRRHDCLTAGKEVYLRNLLARPIKPPPLPPPPDPPLISDFM